MTTQINLIKLNKVLDMTCLTRSAFYSYINKGLIPKPIKIGERSVAWVESEISEIIKARVAGKSNDELKGIVQQLETDRLKDGENV